MKYLITGGAGFIGSNITKKLLETGEEVRILDNLSTGNINNLNQFLDKVEFINGDFSDIEIARQSVKGVDFVLHHGAIPSVQRSIDNPIETNNVNISGTLNMLIACRDEGVKKFIYAASSSAYGDSPTMPKEESMMVSPKSPYAIQKLTGEYYCQIFNKIYGLETICLRYFNVFGPNQDPNSPYSAVIPLFIKKILNDENPIIYGDGETSRDFTYVENNIDANIKACLSKENIGGEIINIACGYQVSLNKLVSEINKILGKDIKPIYKEERKGDVKHSLADISKANKLLGYEPKISFEEGLKNTIDFYKN